MADTSRIHFGEDAITKINSTPTTRQRSMQDSESIYSECIGDNEEAFSKKQIFKGWPLMWLAYQSVGVIYGDIGTSPLYVYSSTFTSEPSYDDLLGALSLIIWTLTLVVTIKYVLIVLCADDEGEGGTFAIYTLLSRYCDIIKTDPRGGDMSSVPMKRYLSTELHRSNRSIRGWLERSKVAHAILKVLAVMGVSLIMADGVLTPAQSVLGAIQGLEVVVPDISSATIVGTTCGILVVLFLLQPLGISKLGSVFAPVIIVWLLFNAIFGIYNLTLFDHSVLKAFNPYFAGAYMMRNKTDGWRSLGGILLAFTGVEALFADLGAFSKRAVQISWLSFAFPCLLLAYIGQAAFISVTPSAYSNPFFNCVPPHMIYPSLVIAILAAVVASQALITSTFQLLSQLMSASYFPRIKMVHTSDKFHGQVYIPWANWLLMVGTVIITAVYSNTTKLGQAYGVCVILVTFVTTNLVALVAILVWRFHPALVCAIWLPFITFDGLYLSSALTKFPNGAWFTILLAVILASFFSLWRYGKESQWSSELTDRTNLSSLVIADPNPQTHSSSSSTSEDIPPFTQRLAPSHGSKPLASIPGLGIFFDKAGSHVPQVYEHFVLKFEAQMHTVVLLHLRFVPIPRVAPEDRYRVSRTSVGNIYRLAVRYGYNDHVVTPDLGRLVYEQVRRAIMAAHVRPSPRNGTAAKELHVRWKGGEDVVSEEEEKTNANETHFTEEGQSSSIEVLDQKDLARDPEKDDHALSARARALDDSYEAQTLFLVGKEQLRISASGTNVLKRCALAVFLWVRENTRQKVQELDVPVEKLVEVGFVGYI